MKTSNRPPTQGGPRTLLQNSPWRSPNSLTTHSLTPSQSHSARGDSSHQAPPIRSHRRLLPHTTLTLATAAPASDRSASPPGAGAPDPQALVVRFPDRSRQDDGGAGAEQARDGERQGHAAAAGRPAAGRVRARALRAPHPHHGAQRLGHLPHHLRRLLLGHVPGRPGQQGPPCTEGRENRCT